MSLVIHPLVTARLAVEAGRMTFLRNYGKQIWVPSPFYAVMGGGEPVLVDTSGSANGIWRSLSKGGIRTCGRAACDSYPLDVRPLR